MSNGEEGIIPARFSDHPIQSRVASKRLEISAKLLFLLIVVICQCWASLGIDSSTNLAQPDLRQIAPVRALARTRRAGSKPRASTGTIAGSYARYSSDQQDASSIEQQQRKCREAAMANGHDMRNEFEFADLAISGSRADRQGLQEMLQAARAGRLNVLYFESLSRLAREMIISQTVLKELVYVHDVRVISTSEGLDSDRTGWELMAIFRSWMHGEFLKQLREAVLRGQEEAVLEGRSVGQWCFGYISEPIPDSSVGRGRNVKPRMRIIIEPVHAEWVRTIFRWFVEDRRTIAWIVRELTRQRVPKDHRSTKAPWYRGCVMTVLRNRKYTGIWSWGEKTNVLNPLTGKVRQAKCSEDDVAQFTREFPDRRIIEDDLFFKAQGLLDHNEAILQQRRGKDGKLRGSTRDAQNPRHLLQGIVKCAACSSTFTTGGYAGHYLVCRGYKLGSCQMSTQLRRDRAERLILQEISRRLFADPARRELVYQFAQSVWESQRQHQPQQKENLESQLSKCQSKITRLVDSLESGENAPEIAARLRQRRTEQEELKRQLLAIEQVTPPVPPTRDWIDVQLQQLQTLLNSSLPAAGVALRRLVGSISVEECLPTEGKQRFLRGRFSLGSPLLVCPVDGVAKLAQDVIEIDFRDPPKWLGIVDQVKERIDQGILYRDIAAELNCPRSWTTKALAFWYQQRDLVPPDGRTTKQRLLPTPEQQKLQEQAKALWDEGLQMQEIAKELGCCRDTVTSLIQDWHQSRGLAIPDGRTRRKSLPVKPDARRI